MEIIKYGDFKPLGKQKKKSQIILTHTSRNVEDYLTSLRYRYNGKFDRIPNYIVTKEGKILQLLDNIEHTNYFKELNVNRNGIFISLENLGWLEKQPLEDYYINWVGDIYRGVPFERKWRDYFFWDPYTDKQIKSLKNLIEVIFNDMKIEKNVVEHNTKISGVEKYRGIVTRSNFDSNYTDLSPAFDFEKLTKLIYNE
jgi:N-acetyl-anhydromuramyl-L-alanine amidase AmpD